MAEIHVFRADRSATRSDRLTILLEEQIRSGVDLGPRGVQMEALIQSIEQDAGTALAKVELAAASIPADCPIRPELEALMEALRQAIASLQAPARLLSGGLRALTPAQ